MKEGFYFNEKKGLVIVELHKILHTCTYFITDSEITSAICVDYEGGTKRLRNFMKGYEYIGEF